MPALVKAPTYAELVHAAALVSPLLVFQYAYTWYTDCVALSTAFSVADPAAMPVASSLVMADVSSDVVTALKALSFVAMLRHSDHTQFDPRFGQFGQNQFGQIDPRFGWDFTADPYATARVGQTFPFVQWGQSPFGWQNV